jgi:hypothetical protein
VSDPNITIGPGAHFGTFAHVETGGRINLDGATIRAGQNVSADKWFDVGTTGVISAKNFVFETQGIIPTPATREIPFQLGMEVAGGLIVAILLAVAVKLRKWLLRQLTRIMFWGVPVAPSKKANRRKVRLAKAV